MRITLSALCAMAGVTFAAAATLAAERPPQPTHSTDPDECKWEWKEGGGIGVWTERCQFDTGVWEPKFNSGLPGFILTVDGESQGTILQVFAKPADRDIPAILPELRKRGYIPDDDECVFATDPDHPAAGPLAFFTIMPTGSRKEAYEATPEDEVPDNPCGEYGWGPEGIRYFMTDTRHPDRAVYLNIGQDGTMFDPATVTLE